MRMDLLFTYTQEKKDKKSFSSNSNLNVFENETNIMFIGKFHFEYPNNIKLTITHELDLNIVTGNFKVTYIHQNNDKITKKTKENDFKLLVSLVEIGMIQGENSRIYWGVQYRKANDKVSTIFYNKIKNRFKNDFYNKSLFCHKSAYSFMFRLIVNYYLDKNGIKSHDGIYHIIEDNFPAKMWLKKNDYNFLPSVLDSYGIKSKYFIKELNPSSKINLKALKYICNLFGDNYIDYIKQIDWKGCSTTKFSYTKKHVLKNEYEKKTMVKVINEFKQKEVGGKNIIQLIYAFMSNKDELTKMNLNLKFKFNNIETFYDSYEQVNGFLRHKKRGYRIRYTLPSEFVEMVEKPFIIENKTFIPKILATEDDFIIEGHQMKNCMAQQFTQGIIFIYISLKSECGTVNLQYKKGKLIQSRGKANSNVIEEFKDGIHILTDRLMSNPDVKWIKEKFDFL
jgi:hypothetical protein